MVIDRGGGLQMFFVSLSKCSSCFTYVLLITFQPITLISVDNATLFVKWSLSLGATSSSFMLLPILKWTCMPYFLQVFFTLSLNPSLYDTVICPLLVLLLSLFLLDLGVLILTFVLFMAQLRYLHITRALCICCCSSSICCWLEHMCLALCKRVLMILYLFAMAWWLSHCKYWLVWVGFCTLW